VVSVFITGLMCEMQMDPSCLTPVLAPAHATADHFLKTILTNSSPASLKCRFLLGYRAYLKFE
jgi:hypothetical protein